MTEPEQTAVALMDRALASRDPLELALAGFLAAYKGRTFVKQHRLIKQYIDWCIQNDLPPLTAKRPHIELFVRYCESQPWSEAYIAQHFICVRSFYKACVRDEILVKNPAEFVNAPKVHTEGQSRPYLTPLEFAAFLEASRKMGPTEHAATALLGLCGLRMAEAVQPARRVAEPGRRVRHAHLHREGQQARHDPAPDPRHARRPRGRRRPHDRAAAAQPGG